jgi:hypothetical protein
MGYCTDFRGHFKLERPLAPHHLAYLQAFNEAPHVRWNVDLVKEYPDPLREAVGLPLGENGCYFTSHNFIKSDDDYPPWVVYRGRVKNDPAYLGGVCPGMPNGSCDWRPNDDGTELIAYADKVHGYIQWLHFLIDHFLAPWGYVLNGEMTWQGEWEHDTGTIVIEKNVITVLKADTLN